MKKKLIPLLAGALSAALLLSACGGRTEPTPEPAVPPAPSQEARPTAAVTSLPETPPPGPATDAPAEPTLEPAPESTPAPTAPAETAKPTPTPAQAGTPKPEPTQAPAVNTPAPTPKPTPAPTPEPTREPPAVTKQAAMAYIGQSAASLAAALGQPLPRREPIHSGRLPHLRRARRMVRSASLPHQPGKLRLRRGHGGEKRLCDLGQVRWLRRVRQGLPPAVHCRRKPLCHRPGPLPPVRAVRGVLPRGRR